MAAGELVAMNVISLDNHRAMVDGVYRGYTAKEYTWELVESNKEGVTMAGSMGFRNEGDSLVGEVWKLTKKGERVGKSVFVSRGREM